MIKGTSLPLEGGLELEKTLNDFLVTTEDFDEGCKAFAEKRRPVFKAK
jgi:enoyl-CoA hydratase/carnithine racemase